MLFCFLPLCWKLLKGRVGWCNPKTQLQPNICSRRRKCSWTGARGHGTAVHELDGGEEQHFRDSQQGQTSGQCTSWQCLAGNPETRGNVRKTRTRAGGGKEHPLRGWGLPPGGRSLSAPVPAARAGLPPFPGTCRCGHAASRVGSSSSGSNSAPVGFDEGGSVRKRFTEN